MFVFVCVGCGAELTNPLSRVALPAHAHQKYGTGIQLPVLMESGTCAVDPEPWGPPWRRWEEIHPDEAVVSDLLRNRTASDSGASRSSEHLLSVLMNKATPECNPNCNPLSCFRYCNKFDPGARPGFTSSTPPNPLRETSRPPPSRRRRRTTARTSSSTDCCSRPTLKAGARRRRSAAGDYLKPPQG